MKKVTADAQLVLLLAVVVSITLLATPLSATTPAISNVSASAISPSAVSITWTTDVASSSQVSYGTTGAYGSSSPLDASLVINHSVELSNLAPATTYHYRVQSADASGNLGTLADFTFSTAASGPGIVIPAETWTMVLTKGIPEQASAWEQLVYVPAVQRSVMLSQYHQNGTEPNESLVGYNFDTNSWDLLDMGGLFHTENMPEGGESVGYFAYDPNNNNLIYHCCLSGSNQFENANHTWWYDVVGQSGRDKQTSPEPPFTSLQPGGAFDVAHDVFVVHGGDSFMGTWLYDPNTNRWQWMTTNGTAPDPSLILPAMAYSSNSQTVYLFGGAAGASYSSDLYVYDVPTNTWTYITPVGGIVPPGRYRTNFAYDSTNNIFLLYGGQNDTGVLGDTWVYDPTINVWTQLNPPQSPDAILGDFVRLSYDSDHNVFVLAHRGTGGYFGGDWRTLAIQTWLFRYGGSGPNAGSQSSAKHPAPPGSLNRNINSWAKDPVAASSEHGLYAAWTETGPPFNSDDIAMPHIYTDQYSAGDWLQLGSSYASISGDNEEAHAPSMAVIGNTPWVSWYQANVSTGARIFAANWNGSTWQTSAIGVVGTPAYQGRSQLADVRGVPFIAFLEVNKSTYPQSAFAYVKAWSGSTWILQGAGPLNRTNSTGSTASSISIVSDGQYPYVAWTEYLRTFTAQGDTATRPQVYVSHWNGSQWAPVGGSLNIDSGGWAYDASIAYWGGQPYVAWVERSQTGNAQLYVRAWNGTGWVLVGTGSLNQDVVNGWAFHPSLIADPTSNSIYVAWIEQTSLGRKAQVFVSKYSGSSWTTLGGPLNADPTDGSAQRVSLALLNNEPVAVWGEVNLGWLRQIYAKQWNGSGWTQLSENVAPADTSPPSAPTVLSATKISANQINVSWSGSMDTVGLAGYFVYRGGTQIANVISELRYSDASLTPSTSYSYTVAAYDAAGNISQQSSPVTQSTAATIGTPTVATPTFSPPPGSYSSAQTVTLLDSTPGATVHCTTDGSTPTAASPVCTTLAVSNTTTIKAIGTLSGYNDSAVASGTYTITPTVATPTFSPPPGSYSSAQTVALSDSTPGATVHCTTDGSTPNSASPVCTTLTVSTTTTIKAIGTSSGYKDSEVASGTYTIAPTVATPTFSPPPGSYSGAQTVTLLDSTPGATVHCTTDGSTPTAASPVCTTLAVSNTTTIKAIGTLSGYDNSAVASGTYTITPTVATPTFSPPPGSYSSAQTVTLSDSTPGATVHCTTDGSTPTAASPVCTRLAVSTTTTIKAIGTLSGYNDSAVASGTYTITPTVATPTFSPPPGSYSSAQTVTLLDSTPGATVHCTTDGSTPTAASPVCTTLAVSTTTTIKAIGTLSGYDNSAVASGTYTITPTVATPTFSPPPGSYSSAQTVTLLDSTPGATVHCTTDGSTPTAASPVCTTLAVSTTTTIKAIGTLSGYDNSAVASGTYTITPTVATPTFSPPRGSYRGEQTVTLLDSTPGATVHCTIDGSTPTAASPVCTTLAVSTTTTIKAIGTLSGYNDSAVASGKYVITGPRSH